MSFRFIVVLSTTASCVSHRWPEAEWYIMIEDDTYVFQDTIQAFLAQFDPQQAHYLGYPTRGATQCRDPTDPAPQDRGQTFHLTDSPTQQELDHPVASSTVQLQSIRQILINTGVLKQQESNRRSLIPEASQYNSPHTPYTPLHSQHQQHNEGSQLPQDASAQQAPDAQSMTSTAAQQQPATAVDPPTIPIAQQQSSEEMFALSGAGMILSQGAMVKLGPLLRGCMLSSQDCYLDDVRLFLCLKEAGISLNTASNYEALTFAPNSNIDWGRFHPCTRAVVFHGVSCPCSPCCCCMLTVLARTTIHVACWAGT